MERFAEHRQSRLPGCPGPARTNGVCKNPEVPPHPPWSPSESRRNLLLPQLDFRHRRAFVSASGELAASARQSLLGFSVLALLVVMLTVDQGWLPSGAGGTGSRAAASPLEGAETSRT